MSSKYQDKSTDVVAQDELYERLDRIRGQASSKLANQKQVGKTNFEYTDMNISTNPYLAFSHFVGS